MINKASIISETSRWTIWWIEQRKKKLREQLSDTMSVNPFLLPILFEFHNIKDFGQLSNFIVASHLMIGHGTGFGKLIDEKILPNVFKTEKLDKAYRQTTPPFTEACFNEIDHVVKRPDGATDLLSLKAGKWTIQLTMAMQLNYAFKEILDQYGTNINEIAVGVFYGTKETLTDKYDILRGINRGAKHNVFDVTDRVQVYAGKDFWTWLNDGEEETQKWVMEGIFLGIKESNSRDECATLLDAYNQNVATQYNQFINDDGTVDWQALLIDING